MKTKFFLNCCEYIVSILLRVYDIYVLQMFDGRKQDNGEKCILIFTEQFGLPGLIQSIRIFLCLCSCMYGRTILQCWGLA